MPFLDNLDQLTRDELLDHLSFLEGASFKALLKSVVASGRIRSHYENYPEDPSSFKDWVEKADHLWRQAGTRMK